MVRIEDTEKKNSIRYNSKTDLTLKEKKKSIHFMMKGCIF